jgi:hypothetical protein
MAEIEIPGPYEYWDMADGETRKIRVLRWELGWATIQPREAPPGTVKRVQVLRLHLPPDIKPTIPHYWDISSNHLREALMPYLQAPDYTKKLFTITKYGVAPRARFTLEVSPI